LSATHLPPVYVDLQEEIESNLQEIAALTQDLKRMHQKRIKESFFEEDETLHLNIQHKTHSITSLIKQSELKLKELMNVRTTEKSDEQSKSFCQSLYSDSSKEHANDSRGKTQISYFRIEADGKRPLF
jgi:hypothetical protein